MEEDTALLLGRCEYCSEWSADPAFMTSVLPLSFGSAGRTATHTIPAAGSVSRYSTATHSLSPLRWVAGLVGLACYVGLQLLLYALSYAILAELCGASCARPRSHSSRARPATRTPTAAPYHVISSCPPRNGHRTAPHHLLPASPACLAAAAEAKRRLYHGYIFTDRRQA